MDYKNLTKLPKEFQDRIERFNRLFIKGAGHSFEEDTLYKYEMICIAQVSRIGSIYVWMSCSTSRRQRIL